MPVSNYRLHTAFAISVLFAASGLAAAQAPPAASPGPNAPAGISTGPALATLRPALNQVSAAIANLRISHWKVPGNIRSTSQEDVASIQRDLSVTLPPMLDQAEAAGSSAGPLAPSFAIFRNIDALYDVLLRVTEMANLAGSTAEAGQLEDARAALEAGRAQLADSILASVTALDGQLARLRAQIAIAAKAPPPVPTKIVINDGPEAPKKRRKRKPATHPAVTRPPAPPSQ